MGWLTDYIEKLSLVDYATEKLNPAQKSSPFLWKPFSPAKPTLPNKGRALGKPKKDSRGKRRGGKRCMRSRKNCMKCGKSG